MDFYNGTGTINRCLFVRLLNERANNISVLYIDILVLAGCTFADMARTK